MHTFRLAASATSNGEGSPKTPTPVDDSGEHHDLANGDDSSIFTLEPYAPSAKGKLNSATSSILHAKPIPLDWSFDIIYEEFSRFGNIKEIKNRLGNNYQYFESWIIFSSDEDALRAYNDFNSTCVSVSFAVPANVPKLLDIYRPYIPVEDLKTSVKLERLPVPPRWLILSSRSERGNLFKIKQFIGQKLGHVNSPDISRFGKDSFLVHTKSDAQAVMLLNMKLDTKSLVKGVKPHFTFSYAKGVFFNEDIYELSENEILTMCPDNVWKIFKVPKSNMIVITFMDSIVPHEIIIENEIIKVRPYRQRPLQCFNCFGFAHVSDVCTRAKICQFCSQLEHGACTRPRVCANCRESHDSRNKSCNIFKKEQEALLLSAAEHISIGHAKKLLSQRSYSAAVQDFHPKPALSTTGLDRPQTVQSKTSRASSGGAPGASSGGDPGTSSGGDPGASSGRASRASSGGAPRPPLVGLLGPPLVGILGPPLVGILGPPLVGLLGPPLVGLLEPPLVGLLGPPLVGLLWPPLVGLLGPPLVGLVGLLGPPLVGLLGPPLVGLLGPPLVGILGLLWWGSWGLLWWGFSGLLWWGSSGLLWWGSSGLLWWGSSGLLWWGSSGLLWWGSSGLLWWGSSGLLWWGSSGLLWWGSSGLLWWGSSGLLLWGSPSVLWWGFSNLCWWGFRCPPSWDIIIIFENTPDLWGSPGFLSQLRDSV